MTVAWQNVISVCGISYLDLTVICGFSFKSLGCLGLSCRIWCEFPVWTSYAWALMLFSGANNSAFFIFPIGIQNYTFSPDQANQKSLKMKLNCICCILPIITMRAQDLPAYVKSKKNQQQPFGWPYWEIQMARKPETWPSTTLQLHWCMWQGLLSSSQEVVSAACAAQWSSVVSAACGKGKASGILLGIHLQHTLFVLQHTLCTLDPHLRFALAW